MLGAPLRTRRRDENALYQLDVGEGLFTQLRCLFALNCGLRPARVQVCFDFDAPTSQVLDAVRP
jgi:hypothetical protein